MSANTISKCEILVSSQAAVLAPSSLVFCCLEVTLRFWKPLAIKIHVKTFSVTPTILSTTVLRCLVCASLWSPDKKLQERPFNVSRTEMLGLWRLTVIIFCAVSWPVEQYFYFAGCWIQNWCLNNSNFLESISTFLLHERCKEWDLSKLFLLISHCSFQN